MNSNAASAFATNRNRPGGIAHISSSQQYIDAHGDRGSVGDHMALRMAGPLAESATMDAAPGGSSQALLEENMLALNASRDSKGAVGDSLN